MSTSTRSIRGCRATAKDGGGDLGLKVEDSDQFTFAFSPTLEVGGRVAAGNAVLRPYAYAGVSILTDDDWTAKARFTGAPSGTGSFETSLPIDDVVARIGAGVQVLTDRRGRLPLPV